MNIIETAKTAKTRLEVIDTANAAGITGHAAELLVSIGANHRHELRMRASIEHARDYIYDWVCPFTDEGPTSADVEAAAALTLLADIHGIGGLFSGAFGSGTGRLLSRLGKGRWNASDGPAYRAAAASAVHQLTGGSGISVTFTDMAGSDGYDPNGAFYDVHWIIRWHGRNTFIPLSSIPPEWTAAIAASVLTGEWPEIEGVWWAEIFPTSEDPDAEYSATMAEWSQLYNWATSETARKEM